MDKPKNLKELKKRLLPFINYENTVQLNKESKVTNVGKMIKTHLSMLEANSGNKLFMPYWDRLVTLLAILESGWE